MVYVSSPPSYSRQSIICAADMLKALGHTGFDRFLMEINLPDLNAGRGTSLMARATSLASFAINNPTFLSPERRTIAYEIMLRAVEIWRSGTTTNLIGEEREGFAAAIRREGMASWLANGSEASINTGGDLSEDDTADSSTAWPGSGHASAASQTTGREQKDACKRVFLVHGHDKVAMESVARFLSEEGLTPIILHEQASGGRTVIEKLEYYSDVQFAVVLMTPDDVGGEKEGDLNPRARQNVVAELFYFIGKLGRTKVCALKKGVIEIPSDIGGVVYVEMDEHGAWRSDLRRELADADIPVKWEKALR